MEYCTVHELSVLEIFQNGLCTHIKFTTTFHPQIDDQAESTIQILEDMLRAFAIEFKGHWDDHCL